MARVDRDTYGRRQQTGWLVDEVEDWPYLGLNPRQARAFHGSHGQGF